MPRSHHPGRRRSTTPLLGLIVLVAIITGTLLALRTHHTTTPTPAVPGAASAAYPDDPMASITPMDPAGITTFPLTHMTITTDGVRLNVSVDDGSAIPTTVIRATVPLNGTTVTPTPGTNCANIPGQSPACVLRWQVHHDQVSAWIEAQQGQCELVGSTTPGVRTQVKCATTHQ